MRDMNEIMRIAERMVNIAWDIFEFDDNADALHNSIIYEMRKHVIDTRGDDNE